MVTEKRLIDANAFKVFLEGVRQDYIEDNTFSSDFAANVIETVQENYLELAPTVEAVELDKCNFKLHHILIDNEGVPEVKIQIGDRYFILRTDPVDVVEVVHGRLIPSIAEADCTCSVCGSQFDNVLSKALAKWNYCPNCGAKMDGGADNGL